MLSIRLNKPSLKLTAEHPPTYASVIRLLVQYVSAGLSIWVTPFQSTVAPAEFSYSIHYRYARAIGEVTHLIPYLESSTDPQRPDYVCLPRALPIDEIARFSRRILDLKTLPSLY